MDSNTGPLQYCQLDPNSDKHLRGSLTLTIQMGRFALLKSRLVSHHSTVATIARQKAGSSRTFIKLLEVAWIAVLVGLGANEIIPMAKARHDVPRVQARTISLG